MESKYMKAASLKLALGNLGVWLFAVFTLHLGLIAEPWDLITISLVGIVCPTMGAWIALSGAKKDLRDTRNRSQALTAIVLSVVVFGLGLVFLASLRP